MARAHEALGEHSVREVAVRVVDADVHPSLRSPDELRAYMPAPWRDRALPPQVVGATSAAAAPLYVAPNGANRRDARPPGGGAPCSDPDFAARQLFEQAGVDLAILIPTTMRPMTNPEYEAAVAAATNRWQDETWLSQYNRHGRYWSTLRVNSGNPELAAREIERWGGHPRFVQVMLVPSARAPFGQPYYDPIYAAAARHNLPIATHINKVPGMAFLKPPGFASYFFEDHSLYPALYGTHLVSLLCEGTFERFPALRFVFVEGGYSWLLPLLWRLDRHWRELRSEAPALRRRPSAYVREHIRFTTQPIEEPQQGAQLARVLDLTDAEHVLMFATDYPHWDFDAPLHTTTQLPERMRERVLARNAQEFYGLPTTRAASA